MVWKKLIVCVALAVFLAVPITASAETTFYYDSNIPTSVQPIITDIIEKNISPNENYVAFRYLSDDTYTSYIIIIGDNIEVGVNYIDYYDCIEYTLRIYNYSNSNKHTLSRAFGAEDYIESDSNLCVYSNLGHYPDLIERSNYYDIATLILLLTAICLYLLRSIFGFCLRIHR